MTDDNHKITFRRFKFNAKFVNQVSSNTFFNPDVRLGEIPLEVSKKTFSSNNNIYLVMTILSRCFFDNMMSRFDKMPVYKFIYK